MLTLIMLARRENRGPDERSKQKPRTARERRTHRGRHLAPFSMVWVRPGVPYVSSDISIRASGEGVGMLMLDVHYTVVHSRAFLGTVFRHNGFLASSATT